MKGPIQYGQHGDKLVSFGGEIWLRDSLGIDVDLTQYEDLIPEGVRAPSNSAFGIERSDELAIYESDFAAAEAVVEALTQDHGQSYTIWFETGEN